MAFSLGLRVRTRRGGQGDVFFPFFLGRATFMGLRIGYNWDTIVIINVPAPVGRPKTFDPSIATYVAPKGAPSPPRF